MLPDTYACCPPIKSETAVLAGSGAVATLLEEVADGAGAFTARDAATGADAVDCEGGIDRPVSMTAKPTRTTPPVASPTVFHGIGRGAGASCLATSGSPHRRHLTRPLFTFAPHAAQVTAEAATYRTSRHERIRTPTCPTPLL